MAVALQSRNGNYFWSCLLASQSAFEKPESTILQGQCQTTTNMWMSPSMLDCVWPLPYHTGNWCFSVHMGSEISKWNSVGREINDQRSWSCEFVRQVAKHISINGKQQDLTGWAPLVMFLGLWAQHSPTIVSSVNPNVYQVMCINLAIVWGPP